MGKMKKYETIIKEILQENADFYKGTTNPLDLQVISDKEGAHYQLLMLGWQGDDYIFQCLLHLDIREEKIWVQWNDTDTAIEEELVKRGVPTTDIVLGLKHPEIRPYTDFAAA